jgi:hypothetical protein
MEMKYKVLHVAKPLIVLVGLAVLAGMVMFLWNLVVPGLFIGSHSIDYWHALGLLVLCRILFGGFVGHRGWHRHQHWDTWKAMTPEEREKFLGDRAEHWRTHRRDRR